MKIQPSNRFIDLFYTCLLMFYPAGYRQEFAEEMREVFLQAVGDASREGPLSLGALFAGELLDLPAAVLQARLRARAGLPSVRRYPPGPAELTWRELLLALAVFLLPAGMLLVSRVDQTSAVAGWDIAILFLVVMAAAGFLRSPLRSLPYFGIILAVAGYLYLFQWVAGLVSPALISSFSPGPLDRSAYLLLKIVSNGMLWLMLFCLTLLVVALLALFNRFQPLFRRVDHDWTLLSYILYGESAFALLFLFESYRYETSYAIASLLCLAAGGWLYLRSDQRRRRILALSGGLTLAVWISALGAWLSLADTHASLIAILTGQDGSPTGIVLLAWVLMILALLLPGLLSRLPARQHSKDGFTPVSP